MLSITRSNMGNLNKHKKVMLQSWDYPRGSRRRRLKCILCGRCTSMICCICSALHDADVAYCNNCWSGGALHSQLGADRLE